LESPTRFDCKVVARFDIILTTEIVYMIVYGNTLQFISHL
jgi:hypothetical protein